MAAEMHALREGFVEGFRDGVQLAWALLSAPFRIMWAYLHGRSEVSHTIRTHWGN